MDTEQAIELIGEFIDEAENNNMLENYTDDYVERQIKAHSIALEALRAQQERENPKPLTEDELRARKNQPIYWYNIKKEVGDWRIVSKYQDSHDFIMFRDGASEVKSYGITWLAYDHEPATFLHPVIAEALEPFRPKREEE